jgi:hypothetical protein
MKNNGIMLTASCIQHASDIQLNDFINESWGHNYALAIKMWPYFGLSCMV